MTEPDPLPAPEPEKSRPRERPGVVRRDCEPHRGNWLRLYGGLALLVGMVAGGCVVLAIVSLPLGIVVWRLAARDLSKMRAGQMDPGGQQQALDARACARVAVLFPVVGLVLWSGLFLVAWLVPR